MSEDAEDFDPTAPETDSPAPADIAAEFGGPAPADDELSPAMQEQVTAAVARLFRKELDAMAQAQFSEVLTPELFDRLRTATARQLAATLDNEVAQAETAAANAEAKPVYDNLKDFVDEVILTDYRREVIEGNQKKWCPSWFLHGEAYRRFQALWRAWEHLRKDPNTGPSVFWKDHLDHHMGKLFDPHGPFVYCSVKHGHSSTLEPLPAAVPPAALFTIPDTESTESVTDRVGESA